MFQKILAALDRSETSSQVFDQAVSLAKATDASLMLLTVLAPFEQPYLNLGYPGMSGTVFGASEKTMQLYLEQWKKLEQEGLEWLRSQESEATKAGVKTEFTHSAGDPGRVICALAQTWEADLIIVGRRGLSGLGEIFLGSVSNYVLHHAPCSVLTMQTPLPPDQAAPQTEPTTVKPQ